MLKSVPPTLTPDLLWALAAMGHGDRLVVVDANYPAYSHHERVMPLPGVSLVRAVGDILKLLPVDDFIEHPVCRMIPDGESGHVADVHRDIQELLDAAEGRQVKMQAVERTPFYELAAGAFGVVATTDNRPYGCFILTKGVIRSPGN